MRSSINAVMAGTAHVAATGEHRAQGKDQGHAGMIVPFTGEGFAHTQPCKLHAFMVKVPFL